MNVIIGPDSLEATALATAKAFSLCAQSEELPYRYVTVEGPVVETGPAPFDERAVLVVRYLGESWPVATSRPPAGSTAAPSSSACSPSAGA